MANSIHKGKLKAVKAAAHKAAEMYFDVLKKQVSQFKNSEEGRHAMCKAVEEFVQRCVGEVRDEVKAEGRAEGKTEGKRENMLATVKR